MDLDSLLPQDVASEGAVLGAIIHDGESIHLIDLEPEDFYVLTNQKAFREMKAMVEEGIEIDGVTLPIRLKQKGIISSVTETSKWCAPSAARIEEYAAQIKTQAMARKLHQLGERLVDNCRSGDPFDLATEAIENLAGVSEPRGIIDPPQWINVAEGYMENKRSVAHPSGFKELDEKMNGGLHFGGTLMVGGDSGSGKTILALDFIRSCMGLFTPTYIVSRDQTNEDIGGRILAGSAGIERPKIRESEVARAKLELTREWPMWFHPREAPFDVDTICNYIKINVATHGVRVWVVDFLQRIDVRLASGQRHSEGAIKIADTFSNLAQDTNTCGILISRVNKPTQGIATQHRFSGEAGVQNACDDMVFVHPVEYSKDDTKTQFWPHEIRNIELIGKRNFGRHFVPLKLEGELDRYKGYESWTYSQQEAWNNDRRE